MTADATIPAGGGAGVLAEVMLPPDPKGTLNALRRAGYTLESAVADLVDNSVSAGASQIFIVMEDTSQGRILRLTDNGRGMTVERLTEAMRLSATSQDAGRQPDDLGHFGIGMKAAALHLSHSGRMSVDTRPEHGQGGHAGWSVAEIAARGWYLRVFETARTSTGTTVTIHDPVIPEGPEGSRSLGDIARHLALAFGPLMGKGLRLSLQGTPIQGVDLCAQGLPGTRRIGPWSWDSGSVQATLMILPAALGSADGPDGRRAHAGLHLRRGDRAITWGGWLNLLPASVRDAASDRVRLCVSIPTDTVETWGIDLAKSRVVIPVHLLPDLRGLVKQGLTRAGRVRGLRSDAGESRPPPDSPWLESGRINREHRLVAGALSTPSAQSIEMLLQALEEPS